MRYDEGKKQKTRNDHRVIGLFDERAVYKGLQLSLRFKVDYC